MENKKLINTAKALGTITKVASTAFQIAAIVCAVFAVLVMIFGEKMIQGTFTLDLDFVKLHLAQEYQTPEMMKLPTVVGLLNAGVLCFGFHYAAVLLDRILVPMCQGRPFDPVISENLKKIGWVVFIGGTLTQLLGVVSRVITMMELPVDEIFASPAVTELEFVFSIDFSFVLVFLAVKLLAYIVDYGHELQRRSDETQ